MVNTPTKAGKGLFWLLDVSNNTKLNAVSEYRHTRGVFGGFFNRSAYFIIEAILDENTIAAIVIAKGICCVLVNQGRSETYSNTATTKDTQILNLFNALI